MGFVGEDDFVTLRVMADALDRALTDNRSAQSLLSCTVVPRGCVASVHGRQKATPPGSKMSVPTAPVTGPLKFPSTYDLAGAASGKCELVHTRQSISTAADAAWVLDGDLPARQVVSNVQRHHGEGRGKGSQAPSASQDYEATDLPAGSSPGGRRFGA